MNRRLWRALAIGWVTLVCAIAASETRRIFEHANAWFLAVVTVVGCGLVAFALRTERLALRLAAHAAVIILGASYAVVAEGGSSAAQIFTSPVRGLADVLGARWPVPISAPAMGFVVFVCGIVASTSAELAEQGRFRVAIIAPPTALIGLVALFAARSGPPRAVMLAFYCVACVASLWAVHHWIVAAAAPAVPASENGRGRSLPAGSRAVAVLAVGALAVPLMFDNRSSADGRYDPRQVQRTNKSELVEISPLARLDEFRSRPAEVLFTASTGGISEWRLVGLTRYDGKAWMPSDDFRPIGKTLAARESNATSVDLTIDALREPWVPWAGEVSTISTRVRTDSASAGLLLDQPTVGGQHIKLRINRANADSEKLATATSPARRSALAPDLQVPASVNELAARIVTGAASDYDRAARIAAYLKANYSLDSESLPGHTMALLDLFLEQTKRGRDEQFVASFGVLAAAVGLPVRVVVGFVATPDVTTGRAVVSSRDIKVWPEVEFNGIGWARFDPVPAKETPPQASASAVPAGGDQPTAGAGSPPPPAAAPVTPNKSTDESKQTNGRSSAFGHAAVRTLAIAGPILALVAGYVAIVLALKRRRRRRRLAGDGASRVSGAFVSAIDTLVDLGLTAMPTATDAELVDRAELVERSELFARPGSSRRTMLVDGPPLAVLEDMAGRSTGAVFGPDDPDADEVTEAHSELDQFEREMAGRLGRLRWLRAQLSLRSLRAGLPDDVD